jgi:nitrite reductase (NO-forming)
LIANAYAAKPEIDPVQGQEIATMTAAPNLPPPIARNYATKVVLDIEIKEQVGTLADGVKYTFWTFGDTTPGGFIRVREGDLVETRVSNHPDNSLAHNIDFHGAIGPKGGSEASFVAPGHSATFTWRALRPGLYLYDCVAPPNGVHVANGMYGLILVEPKGGLPKVDKEFYVAQGEFYTQGKFGDKGAQAFSAEKAQKEQPDYVVFNGRVGALMGEHALRAKVGESVRVYFGNAGPSLLSSFHINGEIFDSVYAEGGIMPNQHNVQTTAVPAGGTAMVEFTARVPGEYTLVDNAMFRANKGAVGQLLVDGPDNDEIYLGRTAEAVFQPGTHLERLATNELDPGDASHGGAQVFSTVCYACHQNDAQGLPNVFPPLAKSDFLMADKDRAVRAMLFGLQGTITVNGKQFNGAMPKPPITEEQIASVLTYVRSNFGNNGDGVTLADVKRVREASDSNGTPRIAKK